MSNLWPIGTKVFFVGDNDIGTIIEVDKGCPENMPYTVRFEKEGDMWCEHQELRVVEYGESPVAGALRDLAAIDLSEDDEDPSCSEAMTFNFYGHYGTHSSQIEMSVDCGGDALYLDKVLDKFAEFLRASGYTYVQGLTAVKG